MRTIPGLPQPTGALAVYLGQHAHALSRHEVLDHWSRHHLDAALRSGAVTRVMPGVFCATAHARNPVVVGEALNLWAPRGLVSGALALHLYSPKLPAPTIADLVIDSRHHPRSPSWVRLRRTGPVSAQINVRGVRTVEMPMAVLHAWSAAPSAERREVLYGSLWERVCTWRQVKRALETAPRVAGRRDLERVLSWFAEGATSPLEVRAKHDAFAGSQFRDFSWQAEIRIGSTRMVADMLHRQAMIVVELDGERFHSEPGKRRADLVRDVELAAAGYVTLRFGWRDVVERPRWCRDRVLAVVRARTTPAT